MTGNLGPTLIQIESDIVVIGGGGAGLAAALSAAEQGISNITLLEKRNSLGGNTARATGLFACESPAQAREKIIADKDELFQHAMNWMHWNRINPKIFRAFLNKSGDTIRWLETKGLEFNVITFFPNQNPRVEHVAKGRGAQVIQTISEQSRAAGVKIFTQTAGSKLTLDDHNAISGVSAESADSKIDIKTRAVIIATGGFGGNKELLKRLCFQYYEGMPLRGVALTGDGIRLAEEAGVEIDNSVTLLKEGPRVDQNIWPLGGLEREPLTLWVNKLGKRFVDESIGVHPFESVNALLSQPEKVSYSLLDSAIKQRLLEKTAGLNKSLAAEAARGRVMIADTWAEIAGWMAAEPAVLEMTIAEYNGFCQQGYDPDFAKARRNLMPLLKPPYYAIRGYPYILDTLGGIKINERMEALKSDGSPVAGLYAAGVITSGWESESYCSDLSGSAFGYAINSGRIAGENAAQFIKQGIL